MWHVHLISKQKTEGKKLSRTKQRYDLYMFNNDNRYFQTTLF
jgi:hypothetical protein